VGPRREQAPQMGASSSTFMHPVWDCAPQWLQDNSLSLRVPLLRLQVWHTGAVLTSAGLSRSVHRTTTSHCVGRMVPAGLRNNLEPAGYLCASFR
jgi:hypothetical protein